MEQYWLRFLWIIAVRRTVEDGVRTWPFSRPYWLFLPGLLPHSTHLGLLWRKSDAIQSQELPIGDKERPSWCPRCVKEWGLTWRFAQSDNNWLSNIYGDTVRYWQMRMPKCTLEIDSGSLACVRKDVNNGALKATHPSPCIQSGWRLVQSAL